MDHPVFGGGAVIGIGLVPDTGATYFVAHLLGYARAFEWLCSNRRLSAADAHAWGLVAEVVEPEVLEDLVDRKYGWLWMTCGPKRSQPVSRATSVPRSGRRSKARGTRI